MYMLRPKLSVLILAKVYYKHYGFSSLYGYIYKIKLYICLKNTHDIGVCGH